jgi:hypothetical protein
MQYINVCFTLSPLLPEGKTSPLLSWIIPSPLCRHRQTQNREKRLLVTSCLSAFPFFHPHGTNRFPVRAFEGNLIFRVFYEKLSRKFKIYWNLTRRTGLHMKTVCFTWRLCVFVVVPGWILPRMGNVSDKRCRENQNTHFMFSIFFLKFVLFMK